MEDIQRYHFQQLNLLPARFKDLEFVPQDFPVIFSEKLEAIMQQFKAG
jgi:hypothetical protein